MIRKNTTLLPYYDYQLGRVWVEDDKTAAKLFIKDFLATEIGMKMASEGLDHGDNLELILEAAIARFGEPLHLPEFEKQAKLLFGTSNPKRLSRIRARGTPTAPSSAINN